MLERKMWIAFLIDLSVNSNILFSYKFNWVIVKKPSKNDRKIQNVDEYTLEN